jgi:hypothetical protein
MVPLTVPFYVTYTRLADGGKLTQIWEGAQRKQHGEGRRCFGHVRTDREGRRV